MSNHEHEHDENCEHELEGLELPLELETASQVLLEMREQNLELVKIAAQIAGFAGTHGPMKPNELRTAMNSIWEVYSQLYQWIDPEEGVEDEEGDEDEDE
jgi:hypothetical protein